MPEPTFDPSANGHKAEKKARERTGGGQGILIVALVSALTGFSLMLGGFAGTLVALAIGMRGNGLGVPVVLGAAAGGLFGVWFGVKTAGRFGGTSPGEAARRWAIAGGVAGLVGAVALASRGVMFPILAIMLPGIGAWLGDRISQRG